MEVACFLSEIWNAGTLNLHKRSMARIGKTTFHELLINIILETEDLCNFTKKSLWLLLP